MRLDSVDRRLRSVLELVPTEYSDKEYRDYAYRYVKDGPSPASLVLCLLGLDIWGVHHYQTPFCSLVTKIIQLNAFHTPHFEVPMTLR